MRRPFGISRLRLDRAAGVLRSDLVALLGDWPGTALILGRCLVGMVESDLRDFASSAALILMLHGFIQALVPRSKVLR